MRGVPELLAVFPERTRHTRNIWSIPEIQDFRRPAEIKVRGCDYSSYHWLRGLSWLVEYICQPSPSGWALRARNDSPRHHAQRAIVSDHDRCFWWASGYVRESQLSVMHAYEAVYTTYFWLLPRTRGSPLSVSCKAEKLEETRNAIMYCYWRYWPGCY